MTEQKAIGVPYEGWAIVEMMGHRQRAGWVREVEMFGSKLLRIDIPCGKAGDPEADPGSGSPDRSPGQAGANEPAVTEFYGGSAIYAMRPCSERVARDLAASLGDPRPVQRVDYRKPELADKERQLSFHDGEHDGEYD